MKQPLAAKNLALPLWGARSNLEISIDLASTGLSQRRSHRSTSDRQYEVNVIRPNECMDLTLSEPCHLHCGRKKGE